MLPLEEETEVDLIEIPSRFLNALAEKDESEIPGIARQWSETDELDCDPQDLVPIIEALIDFSKGEGGKNVYFTQ